MAEGFEALKEEYLNQMREMYAARQSEPGKEPLQAEVPEDSGTVQVMEPLSEGDSSDSMDFPEELTDLPLSPDSTSPPEPIAVEETEVLDPNPMEPDHPENESGEGRLLVKVVTARGALPVPRARVVISREIDGKRVLQGYDETDESGQTRVFTLPAPAASLSMSPDNQTPYARYIVTVSAEGYIPAEYRGVPVFDGIQSVQQADIQPLLEGQSGDMQSYDGPQQQGIETDSPEGYQKEGADN